MDLNEDTVEPNMMDQMKPEQRWTVIGTVIGQAIQRRQGVKRKSGRSANLPHIGRPPRHIEAKAAHKLTALAKGRN